MAPRDPIPPFDAAGWRDAGKPVERFDMALVDQKADRRVLGKPGIGQRPRQSIWAPVRGRARTCECGSLWFLARYSEGGLAWAELTGLSPKSPRTCQKPYRMGFAPAGESALQATESRLGRKLPPSLRCFYSVSNGWRSAGVGPLLWRVARRRGGLAARSRLLGESMARPGGIERVVREHPLNQRLE